MFFPGILVYNPHASLNNWHLLRQPEQLAPAAPAETTDGAQYQTPQF
ncbi:hypothetical protein NKB10_005594 [Escherichia coli]|nr:hypothetical protein [Escherichia coli]